MSAQPTSVALRTLFILLLVALSGGCVIGPGPHSTGRLIYHSAEFDYGALERGGLAIAAVTQPDVRDYYAEEPIAERVGGVLLGYWPAVRLLSLPDTGRILGLEKHEQLRGAFRDRGVLQPDAMASLGALRAQVRYLLLIDVREEVNRNHQSVTSSEVYEDEVDPKTKERHSHWAGTEYTASWSTWRFVRVLFIIYDLETRRHVWVAIGTGCGGYTNSRTQSGSPPRVEEPGEMPTPYLAEHVATKLFRRLPAPEPCPHQGTRDATVAAVNHR